LRDVRCLLLSGKNLRRKIQQILQASPVEAWAGVLFPAGRKVFMPSDVRDGVVASQILAKSCQAPVLGVFKEIALEAFEFNADRIVVAIGSPTVLRWPCMPGALVATDELPKRAIAANVKVR
jgi:hypothetical protein